MFSDVNAEVLPKETLQSLALLQLPNGKTVYRASMGAETKGSHDHHGPSANTQRNARFDGIAKEKAAFYLDASSGESATLTDEQVAIALATHYLSLPETAIISVQKITRFGQGYDFRNKRLPVWQVSFNTPSIDTLYIDVASGVLVDSSNKASRAEGWAFSTLHKWNFLTPLTGREVRDGLIVTVLTLVLLVSVLGVAMHRARMRR